MPNVVYSVIWLHFLADFILQTDKVAINKSSSFKYLALHVLIYGLPFIFLGWKYALVNAALHGVVDSITSKVTTILYQKNQRHWFFVVIGLDQAIHLTCPIATLNLV